MTRTATTYQCALTLNGDREMRRGAFLGDANDTPGGGSRPTGEVLKAEFTAFPAMTPDWNCSILRAGLHPSRLLLQHRVRSCNCSCISAQASVTSRTRANPVLRLSKMFSAAAPAQALLDTGCLEMSCNPASCQLQVLQQSAQLLSVERQERTLLMGCWENARGSSGATQGHL